MPQTIEEFQMEANVRTSIARNAFVGARNTVLLARSLRSHQNAVVRQIVNDFLAQADTAVANLLALIRSP